MAGIAALRPGGPRSSSRGTGRGSRLAVSVSSIALLLLLWWVAGAWTTFVPPIGHVLAALPHFLAEPKVHAAIAATTIRVIGSLLIASAVGLAAALAMRGEGFWGRVVGSFVNFGTGFPSTIAALLALYIFRRSPVSVYVVVAFITFPFIAMILSQGLRQLDGAVEEMGTVYRLNRRERLRHLVLPQLTPFFFAALRNEYAHAWKVVVIAELFAVNTGMGWQFNLAFDHFLLTQVVLWLLVFMAILLGSEYLIIRPLERYALRWRRQ
ncbi:MAG: ABC transporter permease [Nocardioidaceae bacterium]